MKYKIENVREGTETDKKGKEKEVLIVRFRLGNDFVGRLSIPKEKASKEEVRKQVEEYAATIAEITEMEGETE